MTRLAPAVMVCLFVLALLAIPTGADPCDCMTLTLAGAGMTEINGTYTYTPLTSSQPGWEDGHLWLGPAYSIATLDGNWGLLRLSSTWFCGLFVTMSGGEHVVYILSGYYTNASTKLCPPKTGWVSHSAGSAPTLSYDGCLYPGLGDVDGDGAITVVDVRLCAEIAAGTIAATSEQRTAADIDEDGDVDFDDVESFSEQLLGLCS